MPAEQAHELGRDGVLQAKHFLEQLLRDGINLPFNAYDSPEKLRFEDASEHELGSFSFDLGGVLKRSDPSKLGKEMPAEVFVEVKNFTNGNALLQHYKTFLKRAACVGSLDKHKVDWFIFLASAPFGTSRAADLCDGGLFRECIEGLSASARERCDGIHKRISLIIATPSFRRLLEAWRTP